MEDNNRYISQNISHKNIYNKKNKKILYIGVVVSNEDIEKLNLNKKYFEGKNIKKEYHITLCFSPKHEQIKMYEKYSQEKLNINIIGCGYSDDSVSVHIGSIKTEINNEDVVHFQGEKPLHITIALSSNIKPVDSYKSILEGTYENLNTTINGFIKFF